MRQPPELEEIARRYRIVVDVAPVFPVRGRYGAIAGIAASPDALSRYVRVFASEWNRYPVELVRRAGLKRVAFAKKLSFAGQVRAAIPDFPNDALFLDVASGASAGNYQRRALHHEFFHIIDYKDDGVLYGDDNWKKLNPPGFVYGPGGASVQEVKGVGETDDRLAGFLTAYAQSGVEEDKAEVFAFLMTDPALVRRRSLSDIVLRRKVDALCELLLRFCPESRELVDSFRPAPAPSPADAGPETALLDSLAFGNADSERKHDLAASRSESFIGGLGATARRLLPLGGDDTAINWEGGRLEFSLAVDPERQNYATVRFFGDDVTETRLLLYIDGKQIGYRHLGDIDHLDPGSPEPAFLGRFFYRTTPLPMSLTRGKSRVRLQIRSGGRIWVYGGSFEQYQRPMTGPTRGIYAIHTHTAGFFVPPRDEAQGAAPVQPPRRRTPGPEVLDKLKARVNGELDGLMRPGRPLNQMQMQLLAHAYFVRWTHASRSDTVVARLLLALDDIYRAYRKNPKLAEADPATYNPDWFGLGPSGDVLRLLATPFAPSLDARIDDGAGGSTLRRNAYAAMLIACRDWHRRHRRLYTNQSMINDLYGIYLANCGVAVVDKTRALPEADVRRYLYESIGLLPWRDSDPPAPGDTATPGKDWGVGDNYWQLTKKGLTRELGYVGNYGEVLDWVTMIYDATRSAPGAPGDPKIAAQLVKMAIARAVFRAPGLDADGFAAMRLESVIGWRDFEYPGDLTYAQRNSWDGAPLESAAATLDPTLVGYAQQMLADNQFFASVQERMKDAGFRPTAGLLGIPDSYEVIRAQKPGPHRLPMSPGTGDFAFADEEDGVVAVRRGSELLYVSLYWRARHGVNFLARVHHTTPRIDRIATVAQEIEFTPSGMTYTRADWTDFGFASGGHRYPGDLHSAHAGETLPIAKIPEGARFKPGDESVHAGRGDFYTLRYGPFVIGMNCTIWKTFPLKTPPEIKSAPELISGKTVIITGGAIAVGPMSTVVLYVGRGAN